jgi:hypothetical protein
VEADNVSVERALPPAGGVTTEGLKVAVTPLGSPGRLNVTPALNPFRLFTVTTLVAAEPWLRVRLEGVSKSEKLPWPVTVRLKVSV